MSTQIDYSVSFQYYLILQYINL